MRNHYQNNSKGHSRSFPYSQLGCLSQTNLPYENIPTAACSVQLMNSYTQPNVHGGGSRSKRSRKPCCIHHILWRSSRPIVFGVNLKRLWWETRELTSKNRKTFEKDRSFILFPEFGTFCGQLRSGTKAHDLYDHDVMRMLCTLLLCLMW